MDTENFTKFLDLENFIVTEILKDEKNLIIVGHLKRKEHICPRCGSRVREVKDTRYQIIKDVKAFDKNVFIKIKKQRYICRNCGKSFLEENHFLQKYQRTTNRFLEKIFLLTAEVNSFKFASKELDVSLTTIIRKFDLIKYPKADFKNVEVLSIDEFKGNTGGEKYNCVIADPKNHLILDILPKRYDNYLTEYFSKIEKETRNNIKYFVSDMWTTYKKMCEIFFKNSKFIVDKYHWIRQIIWAFENVRKEEQKKFYKKFRKYFKRSKSLLTKRFQFLTDEQKQEVNFMLYKSDNIRFAHNLKEEFLKILDCKNRKIAKKKLLDWILYAQNSGLKVFEKCADTMVNWSNGILNSFDVSYTNGFIEGCNNKIKVLKRNAYGYRNFERFRNRILHIFNYKKILENKNQNKDENKNTFECIYSNKVA